MADEIPAPLAGDPARQAPALHRGIEFQDWRSVEAWVNLKPGEALYLEGAEDYDVVGSKAAEAVQTRATSGNISLRSDEVAESLLNFWSLSQKHAEKEITLHYLTTSAAAEERQPAFGKGVKGLELWQQCAASGDLVVAEQLRLFLVEDKKVRAKLAPPALKPGEYRSESLRDFLDTAPTEEVFAKLISRVKWDLQSDDSEVIRESVAIRSLSTPGWRRSPKKTGRHLPRRISRGKSRKSTMKWRSPGSCSTRHQPVTRTWCSV